MATPSCKLFVDPLVPVDDLHAAVRRVCKVLVQGWADFDETAFKVSTITGGITNLLLKVEVNGQGLSYNTVAVRIFGENSEAVIDRSRELQALHHLSSAGFGARLIGLFENGMVQSFIVARTLCPPDMSLPKLAAHIAKELRRLHDTEVPGSREPQLWVDIAKFVEEASTVSFDNHQKQKMYESISFVELRQEIDSLKKSCECVEGPVVFAHNDLLSGNIMYSENTGVIRFLRSIAYLDLVKAAHYILVSDHSTVRPCLIEVETVTNQEVLAQGHGRLNSHVTEPLEELHLIDFEYSSYSYRGYDIANHFNEYAGFDCDYSLYPNKEAQHHFFRHYLHPDSPKKTSETELESLYIETNVYALASHIYWAAWAIIQARFSSIDFDYLEYFFLRYNEYKKMKTEYLKLIQLKKQKVVA